MKRILMTAAALGVVALVATPLVAQTVGAPCPWMGAGSTAAGPGAGARGPGARMARMCADAEAIVAGRLAYAETKLALTADQKPAWDRFVTRIREAVPTLKSACPDLDDDDQAPATLPDRLAFMTSHAEAHAKVLKVVKAAVEELYPTLTPDQRKTADGLAPFGMGSGMGMGPGMGMGMGGHPHGRGGPWAGPWFGGAAPAPAAPATPAQ